MSEGKNHLSSLTEQNQPATTYEQKKRHGCFTLFLIFMLYGVFLNVWIFYSIRRWQDTSIWLILFSVMLIILDAVWVIALFKWQKWGFWGYCATRVANVIISLLIGESIFAAFGPLLAIAIIYGVLQIGGENKGWSQLEGADNLNQLYVRWVKKENQPNPGYPAQAKNEIHQDLQKEVDPSSISHNNSLPDSHLSNPPNTHEEDRSKRRGRNLKIFGGSCLLITLCCILGYIGIDVTNLLSNVGVTGNSDGLPKWSPDGSSIAFVSQRDRNADIYVMDSEGSNVIQLTQDPFAIFSFMASSSRDLYPSWSPDGKQIVFSSERDDYLWSVDDFNTYVMDVDGSNQVLLAETGLQGLPAWSPDGQHIALAVSSAGHYEEEIYIMDADGSNLNRLTYNPTDDSYPSWSPDGKHIVFASERDDNWEIYVMDADGSNQIRLTEDSADDIEPHWSPDGKHIIFSSVRDGDWDIYIIDPNGSNVTRLTENSADNNNPSWSPNGDKIAFASDRDGDWEIYVMDADGSNINQLTHNE